MKMRASEPVVIFGKTRDYIYDVYTRSVAPPTRYDSPAQGSDVDFYPIDSNSNPLPTQYGKINRPISTDFTEDSMLLGTDPPQHTVSSEAVNVVDKRSPVFNGGLAAQHNLRHRPGRDKNFSKERPRSWHASKWEVDSSTSPEFKTGMKSPASDTQRKRSSKKWNETQMLKSAVITDSMEQRVRSPSTTSTYSSSRSSRASLDNLDNLPRNYHGNTNISRSNEDFTHRKNNNVNSKKAMFEKMAASSTTSHSGSTSPPNSTYNEFNTSAQQHYRQASSRESVNSEEISDLKLVRTTLNKSRGVVTEEVSYSESVSSGYQFRKQVTKETSDFPYFPHGSQHHMSVVKPVKPVAPGLATHVTDELKPVEIKFEVGQPRYFGVMAVHSDAHKTSPQRYEHLKDATSAPSEASSTVSSHNTDYLSRKFAKSKSTAQLSLNNTHQYNDNFHRSFDDDKLRASGRYGEIWTPPNKLSNNYDPLWKAQSAMPDNQSPVNHRRTSSTDMPPQSTNPSSSEPSSDLYSSSSNIYHSRRAIYSPNTDTSSSMLKFIQSAVANNNLPRPSSAKVESSIVTSSPNPVGTNFPEPEEKDDNEQFCRQIKEMSNKVLRVTSFTRKDLSLSTAAKNPYSAQKFEPNRKPAYNHIKHINHGRSRSFDNELDEGSSSYMRRSSLGKSPRPKSADANKHVPQLRQTVVPTIDSRNEPQVRQTVSPNNDQRSAPHVSAARLHFFPPRRSMEHVKGPESKAFTAKALSEFVRRKQAGSSPSAASEGRPKSHYSSEELSSADEPDVFDDSSRSPDASTSKMSDLMERLDNPQTEKEKRYMQKMKNSSLPLSTSSSSHAKSILPAHKKSVSVDMDLSPPSVAPPPRKQRDRSSNASSATTTSTLSSFSSGSATSNNNKKLPCHPPVLQEIEYKDEENIEPINVTDKKKKPAYSTNTYIIKKKTKNTENLPEVPSPVVFNTKLTIGLLKSPTEEKKYENPTCARISNMVKITTTENLDTNNKNNQKSSSKKSLFPLNAEDLPPPPPPPPVVIEEEEQPALNGNVTPPLGDSYKEQTYLLDSDGDQKQEVEENFPPPPSFVQLPQTYENIIELKEKISQEIVASETTQVTLNPDVISEEEATQDETDSSLSSEGEDDENKKIISEDLAPQDLTEDVIKNDQSLAPLLSTNNKKMRDYVQEIMPSPESKKQRKRQKKNGATESEKISTNPSLSETTATNNLPASSTYYSTSASKKKILDLVQEKVAEGEIETENEDDNIAKKLKLVQSIKNKLNDLQNVREVLKEETKENEELGAGILQIIQEKCTRKEQEKYSLLVEETHQIINLILSISGRMARVENALAMLPVDASDFEKDSLKSKKEKLQEQHEEAKSIKQNIDKRQQTVSEILVNNLDPQDFQDYEEFMKTKISLIIDSRELEDKVKLGREQIHILVDSMPYEYQNNMDEY